MSLADACRADGVLRDFLDLVETEGRGFGVSVVLTDDRERLAYLCGGAPSTLRELIRDRDRPGGHFSGETGFLNLSDLPGHPLPFKVSGYFQLPEAYRRHHLDDETRLRALRVALC